MNDLDWIAEHTYDIGEQIGENEGAQLTDIAILIWDIRADLIAARGREERMGCPTVISRR